MFTLNLLAEIQKTIHLNTCAYFEMCRSRSKANNLRKHINKEENSGHRRLGEDSLTAHPG